MINYDVPLERVPDTHNGHPLTYVALAAQRNYYVLYMMSAYGDPKLPALDHLGDAPIISISKPNTANRPKLQ